MSYIDCRGAVKGGYIPEHDLLRKDYKMSSMLEAFINADYIP